MEQALLLLESIFDMHCTLHRGTWLLVQIGLKKLWCDVKKSMNHCIQYKYNQSLQPVQVQSVLIRNVVVGQHSHLCKLPFSDVGEEGMSFRQPFRNEGLLLGSLPKQLLP
jgi:hypothetical protein